MPPKRATRRNGGTPRRPTFINESGYEPIVNPANQPDLPSIPIGASWNYGAATTVAMPKRINVRPTMDIDQMIRTTETQMEIARERTAAAKKKQPQARQAKREPTPDQTQLQQSLNKATEDHHSEKTPTPPIPHSVSTDSRPETRRGGAEIFSPWVSPRYLLGLVRCKSSSLISRSRFHEASEALSTEL